MTVGTCRGWIFLAADIETEGEHRLAEDELTSFFPGAGDSTTLEKFSATGERGRHILESHSSLSNHIIYSFAGTIEQIYRYIRRTAYAGIIVLEGTPDLPETVNKDVLFTEPERTYLLPHMRIFEQTAISVIDPKNPTYVEQIIRDAWSRALNPHRESVSAKSRKRNEYFFHGLHKYKAKFFPRMARALVNITLRSGDGYVADPMVGSGTTLLEASLMGVKGFGSDIDPLSVLIATAKSDAISFYGYSLLNILNSITPSRQGNQLPLFKFENESGSKIPYFISRKMDIEKIKEIEGDYSIIKNEIDRVVKLGEKHILEIALSHSISTLISLRWMGTGDNRFALEISKRRLTSVFAAHVKYIQNRVEVLEAFKNAGMLKDLPIPVVHVSDAREFKYPIKVEGIVTSPPYLPASSGRETYLRSRAPALAMLGLMTEQEILKKEENILGTIIPKIGDVKVAEACVPESVKDLVNWMLPQRARGPKAIPTLEYFEGLRQVGLNIAESLTDCGRAAIVISAKHQFYALTTREIVREFDMVDALRELYTHPNYKINLKLEKVYNIELPKLDFVQRPASKGAYSEAILIFTK